MQNLKKFFLEFDLFNALPTLRAKGQTQTMNVCGGVLSFLLLATFTYVFMEKFINTIEFKEISVSERLESAENGEGTINGFFFAVGVINSNYFLDVYPLGRLSLYKIFNTRQEDGTYQRVPQLLSLQPCKLHHFQMLGAQKQNTFNRFSLGNHLCPTDASLLEIKYTQQQNIVLFLSLDRCTWQQNCQQNAEQTLKEFQQANNQFFRTYELVLYFVENVVNPSNKDPISKKVLPIKGAFSVNLGVQVFIRINQFTITTDYSIWPVQEMQEDKGFLIDQIKNFYYDSVPPHPYMYFLFVYNPKIKVIERSVGKVDEILSYSGGLFSILISFLSFFMISYNEYRYQLMVAEGAFNFNDDGKKLKANEFNFLKYLKYSAYDWIQVLTCCKLEWKDCKQIEGTRQEANNHLDVSLLFKKLQHHQRSIEYLMSEKEEICLYLTEPSSLKETVRRRKLAEYYDKIIKGQPAMTIEDVRIKQDIEFIFHLGLSEAQKNFSSEKKANSRFIQKIDYSRQNVIDYAFNNHTEELGLKEQQFDLDEYDLDIEKDLARSFYEMKKQNRMRIQQKIPIKILHRLSEKIKQFHSTKNFEIKLE